MTFEQAWQRTSGVTGWLHENEARLLWRGCIIAVPPTGGIMLEIGAYLGRSTTLLGQIANKWHSRLVVIEPFWYAPGVADGDQAHEHHYIDRQFQQDIFKRFTENMGDLRYELQVKPTAEAVLPSDVDFAFIDGDHTGPGVRTDCEHVIPRVRRGGLIAFHDYRPDAFEVKPVVDEICAGWQVFGHESELLALRKP